MRKVLFVLLLCFTGLLPSCHFYETLTGDADEMDIELSLDKYKETVQIGEMSVINLTASKRQNSAKIKWEYDSEIIHAKCDNYAAVITGLKFGTTKVTARCGSNSASCIVAVSSDSYTVTVLNPYVYASHDYVDVKPNSTVKISAALFGGSSADINGFSFSIDKPSVASLSTEGNYCWITGKNSGNAKITVKHNKSPYGYSVLVNCSHDGSSASFITTDSNVITINKSEEETKEFTVKLQNPSVADYASAFTFDTVDELGASLYNGAVIIESVLDDTVTLRANRAGNCYIRCSHPDAEYSLDVLVRVIENAETGFIEPSETICTVTGDTSKKLDLSLSGYSGEEDITLYTWSFSENADEYIDYEILNGNDSLSGNCAYIKAKKTGSVRITVNYPGLSPRCIIVLVRNISSQAADATTYITTSRNYIRLSKDSPAEELSIFLKNCNTGDSENLRWKINNIPLDGSSSDVIRWISGKGTSASVYNSPRSAVSSDYSESAYCLIEPVNYGTAYIEISHPKAIYKTLVTVVVAEKNSSGSESERSFLSLTGNPVIEIKNGETKSVNVFLTPSGDEENIQWSVKEGPVTLTPVGNECAVIAPAEGNGGAVSSFTASYGDSVVSFKAVTYDEEDERVEFIVPSLWSETLFYSIKEDMSCTLSLNSKRIEDFENITWTVVSGENTVSLETGDKNLSCSVLSLKSGTAQIKASYPSCDDVIFTVDIVPEYSVNDGVDRYLSTSDNVVYFNSINEIKTVKVEPVNIDESLWGQIKWECSSPLFEVSANGNTASVTSYADDAEAVLTVTHPLSLNELTINLRSGERYVYINEDVPYITTDTDTLELYEGQEEQTVYAMLNHTEESEEQSVVKGFEFYSDDESVATVSYVNYSNKCYVKPLKNGTCRIIVTHPDSKFEKEVVVIVKHAPDSSSVPYITTDTNVITLIQGDFSPVTVKLVNSDSINDSLWHWNSSASDESIVSVMAKSGTTAMLYGNKPGTTQIKVTHDEAPYALNIIVVVLDSSVIVSRPYIHLDTTIVNVTKGSSVSVSAEMIGGNSASDSNYFKFFSANSGVALVTSASGTASIRGVQKGMTYVTVSNSRYSDSYSRTILVVVEDTVKTGVYITVSQSILKFQPDDTTLTTLTATLVNGQETDGQDFIWWADDYNMVSVNSIADTCSVIPSGKTGTTKIHVKHPKSQKQCDILVLVSKYESFAFCQNSDTITTEKLHFYPMQVPATEENCTVVYSSSNPDICLVEGSNNVAWVCGLDYGTVTLTANLVASDGSVVATAEMLVTVSVFEKTLPVISLGNSILTVESGTSKTFTAIITGEDIEDTEKYNLKWTVKDGGDGRDGISFLNENEDKTAYGSDCYVTFEKAGYYVLSVSHEKSGAETDLFLIVEDKGRVSIELSSYLETVYKDDGSFTITANLINGSPSDYNEIEWSAVKVGGENIVSVSKTKGAVCTVSPRAVGKTNVIARLPNGESAKCVVIVKAAAEITFEAGAVHVIPGYTEVVNYKTTPANAVVNWYEQMADSGTSFGSGAQDYFTFQDDPVKKQLRITGLRNHEGSPAGTITAMLVGTSSANLPKITVYVEYKVQVECFDMEGNVLTNLVNDCPDTDKPKKFNVRYYPNDLDIDIFSEGKCISCITDSSEKHTAYTDDLLEIGEVTKRRILDAGVEKTEMTVSVIPHSEGQKYLKVTGTLPSDASGTYSKGKEFSYSAYYDDYEVEWSFDEDTLVSSGAFSYLEPLSNGNKKLHLSDGEAVNFTVRIKNENAAGSIEGVEWNYTGTKKEYSGKNQNGGNVSFDDFDHLRDNDYSKIWDNNKNLEDIGNGKNLTAKSSFISLDDQVVDGSSGRQTLYTLRHNWDFYQDMIATKKVNNKDTPFNLSDSGKFKDWFGSFDAPSTSQPMYQRKVWEMLKEAGVENLLVVQEPLAYNTSIIGHNGIASVKEISFRSGTEKDAGIINDYYYGYLYMYANINDSLKQIYNCKKTGSSEGPISLKFNGSVTWEPCIPYVISMTEAVEDMKKNMFIFPGKRHSMDITFERNSNGKYHNYLPCANFYTSGEELWLIPVITKNTQRLPEEDVNASLTVKYKTAKQSSESKNKSIAVVVEKRMCEAYTSGKWKKETYNGYERYVLDGEELFDLNALSSNTPEFSVLTGSIESDTSESEDGTSIFYKVYPKDTPVYVTVPDDSDILVQNYKSETVSGNERIYRLKENCNSIDLKLLSPGSFNIKIKAQFTGGTLQGVQDEYTIPVNVYPVPDFEPTSDSPEDDDDESWWYNPKYRLLVLKDGAECSTSLDDYNGYWWYDGVEITDIVYEKLSQQTTDKYNNNPDDDKPDTYISSGGTDRARKTQQYYVTCDIENKTYSGNHLGNKSIVIKHKKDYGYFGYRNNSGLNVQDDFYKKNFSLSDVDDSSLEYNIVYKTIQIPYDDGGYHEETVIDQERTEQNKSYAKIKKLHEMKWDYAKYSREALTSCELPYYWSRHRDDYNNYYFTCMTEPKSFDYTPVGRIIVGYTNGKKQDNELRKFKQEIIVCVQVSDRPCKVTDDYGYEPPESYWD